MDQKFRLKKLINFLIVTDIFSSVFEIWNYHLTDYIINETNHFINLLLTKNPLVIMK